MRIYDADIPSCQLCKAQANHYNDDFVKQWRRTGYTTITNEIDVVMLTEILYKGDPIVYTWYVCLPEGVSPVMSIYRRMFNSKPVEGELKWNLCQ